MKITTAIIQKVIDGLTAMFARIKKKKKRRQRDFTNHL